MTQKRTAYTRTQRSKFTLSSIFCSHFVACFFSLASHCLPLWQMLLSLLHFVIHCSTDSIAVSNSSFIPKLHVKQSVFFILQRINVSPSIFVFLDGYFFRLLFCFRFRFRFCVVQYRHRRRHRHSFNCWRQFDLILVFPLVFLY